jgi:hypothetical protein
MIPITAATATLSGEIGDVLYICIFVVYMAINL